MWINKISNINNKTVITNLNIGKNYNLINIHHLRKSKYFNSLIIHDKGIEVLLIKNKSTIISNQKGSEFKEEVIFMSFDAVSEHFMKIEKKSHDFQNL